MKCEECGDLLGESMFDYDSFCFLCVLGIMAGGSGSPNYEKAAGEYWQEKFEQDALDTPPFWKTPIDPA